MNLALKLLKGLMCLVVAIAAVGNAYLSFEAATGGSTSLWLKVFMVAFELAMSLFLFLMLFGLIKTSSIKLGAQMRVLLSVGLRRAKTMDPGEFDRRVKIEQSIEVEVQERKSERRPPS